MRKVPASHAGCPTVEGTYETTKPPDLKSGGFPVADTHNRCLLRPKYKRIVFWSKID